MTMVVLFIFPVRSEDSCVLCHKKLAADTFVGHSFQDWENSIHQKKGVSCHSCHGGNPEASDKEKAHQGIQLSTQQGSSLYFTNIPETCGQCHSEILGQFKKSAHYSELKASGRGPNCLTCHGSMATWVLRPDQMEQTCTLCHKKPMQAQATLMTLGVAQSNIEKLSSMVPADKKQQEAYKALQADLDSTVQLWHSFDMTKVLEESRRLIRRSRELSTDWKLHPQNPSKKTSQ